MKDKHGLDARVNGCAHEFDFLWQRCKRCGIGRSRMANAMRKQTAARMHQWRVRDAEIMERTQAILEKVLQEYRCQTSN